MSNEITPEQAQESAVFMAQEIHAPAFFEKLSAYGLEPSTEAEAAQLLQLGAVLQHAEQSGQYKTASDAVNEAENPFLKFATDKAIEAMTGDQAVSAPASEEALAKQAAAVATTNPVAKQAALTYAYMLANAANEEASE